MRSKAQKLKTDFLIAALMIIAGLAICGVSLSQIASADHRLAQATPPTQVSPPVENDAPAQSKPGGTRPTTPAPTPATPDPQAQKQGAKAALPPAPPEKIAPPMQSK
jgi:hypothetical protein